MAASAGALLAEQFEKDARLREAILTHKKVGGVHQIGVVVVLAQKVPKIALQKIV